MSGLYIHTGDAVYLTRDGRVVPHGHTEAAFLLIGPGGQMLIEQAQSYGLVGEKARIEPDNKGKRPGPSNKGK